MQIQLPPGPYDITTRELPATVPVTLTIRVNAHFDEVRPDPSGRRNPKITLRAVDANGQTIGVVTRKLALNPAGLSVGEERDVELPIGLELDALHEGPGQIIATLDDEHAEALMSIRVTDDASQWTTSG